MCRIVDKAGHKYFVIFQKGFKRSLDCPLSCSRAGNNTQPIQLFTYSWCPSWAQDAHLMPISVEYVNQLRQPLNLANVEILPKTNRSQHHHQHHHDHHSTVWCTVVPCVATSLRCGYFWCVCVAWDYFKPEHYVLNLPLVALALPLLLFLATLNLYWLRAKGNVGHKKQFILEFRLPTLYVCVYVWGVGGVVVLNCVPNLWRA